ncbi:MAG: LolA family protein [Pseudomonadota bacterium]
MSTVAVIVAEAATGLAAPAAPRLIETPRDQVRVAAVEAPATDVASAPAAVFADVSDQAVADEVMRYLESLTTLSGVFVQTAPSGAVASGKFYLRRPGQVRFDYDDPSPITIVATQGMVYVENSDLETTDSYPLKKTPLRFLLSKEIDIGDAMLKSVDRGPDSVALTYASADEETEGEITLVLSAPSLAIEQWSVRDPQEGVTVVALQDVSAGGKLDNRLFRAPEAGGAFINK